MLYRSIVIYFIIVLVYFKVNNIEKNKLEKFIFSMFIPVFGFLTVILSESTKSLQKEENKLEKNNTEGEKNKEYLINIQSSLVDDLTIDDYEKAREMILAIKPLQLVEQCKICHIAIKSKNVEISHIAAVSLMRIQNYFEKFFVHMELKTDLTKVDNLKKYIDGLYRYLKCKLVQGALMKKYRAKLTQAVKKLILVDERCEGTYYNILVENLIEEANYDEAMQYLRNQIERDGIDDKIYQLLLKICIKTNDAEKLNEVLEKIEANYEMAHKLEHILEFWKEKK